jgi:hypothetical protein
MLGGTESIPESESLGAIHIRTLLWLYKIDENTTEEYKLQHPSWLVNKVVDYKMDCDFKAMYGDAFSVLNTTQPTAVFIAEGSAVGIEWKRNRLNFDHERS